MDERMKYSLVSMVFGMFVGWYLFFGFEYMTPLTLNCLTGKSGYFGAFQIPVIDKVLCIFIHSTVNATAIVAANPFVAIFEALLAAAYFVGALESINKNNNFLVRYCTIWLTSSQYAGVATIHPLVWSPAKMLSPQIPVAPHKLTRRELVTFVGISVGSFVFILTIVGRKFDISDFFRDFLVIIFVFTPTFSPLLWQVLPNLVVKDNDDTQLNVDYYEAKHKVCLFFGVLFTTWYYIALVPVLLNPSYFFFTCRLLLSPYLAEYGAYWFLLDFVCLFTSCFFLILVQSSFELRSAIRFLLASLLISPASAYILLTKEIEEKSLKITKLSE